MLRFKKFACIKNKQINNFIYNFSIPEYFNNSQITHYIKFYTSYFDEKLKNKIKIQTIKITNEYIIKKEIFTDTYLLTCKLCILYIEPNNINKFINFFLYNTIFNFMIYKKYDYYIVFCTSHTDNVLIDLNIINIKYYILSHVFQGDFIILNNNIKNLKKYETNDLLFYKSIGYGNKNKDIISTIKIIIKIFHSYNNNNLPTSYLNLK